MIHITRFSGVWFLVRQQEMAFGAVGLVGPKVPIPCRGRTKTTLTMTHQEISHGQFSSRLWIRWLAISCVSYNFKIQNLCDFVIYIFFFRFDKASADVNFIGVKNTSFKSWPFENPWIIFIHQYLACFSCYFLRKCLILQGKTGPATPPPATVLVPDRTALWQCRNAAGWPARITRSDAWTSDGSWENHNVRTLTCLYTGQWQQDKSAQHTGRNTFS